MSNYIKLDLSEVETLKVEENNLVLIARLVKAIQHTYFIPDLMMSGFMFDILKIFSETYAKDKTEVSRYCYENLLCALNKLYPKEFQRELIKK